MNGNFDIVILGLTITSSWGNGHATTYRGLAKGLASRGHKVLFLERNVEWYASNRDEPAPKGVSVALYNSLEELFSKFERTIAGASLIMVGSYVPQGIEVGEWALAVASGKCVFYDIDTPVTLSLLEAGDADYISKSLISRYSAYLSFSGGPILDTIARQYGSPMVRALYCTVDQDNYSPVTLPVRWDLGYLGTYSLDRQVGLDQLLLEPARQRHSSRFAVVGPQYPSDIVWPANVERSQHLPPCDHSAFYASQRFTLNVTRSAMKTAGYSPSVRMFEAAACGVPLISDWWDGLDSIFEPTIEIFIAETAEDTLRFLQDVNDSRRREVGSNARNRVLSEHSPLSRSIQIEALIKEINENDPACSARRNRRAGKVSGWIDAELPLESERSEASEETVGCAVTIPDSGGLHQPARADR